MRNYGAKDVDTYIESSPEEARPHLKELRKIITTAIPDVQEGISWGVPFYKYQGLLAGFSPFKKHVSFGFAFVIENDERKMLEEKGYTTGKKLFRSGLTKKCPRQR
jgi:uncharacterized protein YdhG (YjbR/CyaY superfamily)